MVASWPKTTTFPFVAARVCVAGAAIIAVTIVAAISSSTKATRLRIDTSRRAAQQQVEQRVDEDEGDTDRDLPLTRRRLHRVRRESHERAEHVESRHLGGHRREAGDGEER